MGTQTAIIETLPDKGADYLLPVKANQPTLHADIIGYVAKAESKFAATARRISPYYGALLLTNSNAKPRASAA
jgi:hypothetical protein